MGWKPTSKCDGANAPYAAVLDGEPWIFRALWGVHAWRDGAARLLWQHELSRKSTGFMMLARAAGHAIAVEVGVPASQSTLHGFDAATGRAAWKRSLPLKPVLQGLAAIGDDVFVLGSSKAGDRVVRVKGATGEVAGEVDAEDTAALRAAAGKLWLSGGGVPLFGAAPGKPFKKILAEAVRSLVAEGDHLYLSIVDEDSGELGVVWFDARAEKERGRLMVGADAGVLVLQPTGEPGRLLVGTTDSSELLLAELARGKATWRKKLDIAPHALAPTPHEIVAVLAHPDQGQRLASFDWATGAEHKAPAIKLGEAAPVYWAGERLIVAGDDQLRAFAWEK